MRNKPKLTLAQVNKALAAQGITERLVHGRGYKYFDGGNAHCWPATAVYVNRVDQLTLEQ